MNNKEIILWKDIYGKEIYIKEEILEFENFEANYELSKTDPNELFLSYYEDIEKVCKKFSIYKNVEKDELIQESYLYFIQYCNKYDPYYMDGFYRFENGVFKHIITNIKSYIQRYYFKHKREPVTDLFEHANYDDKNNTKEVSFQKFINQKDDIETFENQEYLNYLLSHLTNRQRQIVLMINAGLLQDTVAKRFGLSQSRISVINRKSLQIMGKVANNIKVSRSHRRCK